MKKQIRNRHLFISDMLLLPLATYFSFVLRLEHFDLGRYWISFLLFTLAIILIVPLVFLWIGIYTRYWRYASVEESLLLSGALGIATVLADSLFIGAHLLYDNSNLPQSIPIIFFLLALTITAGPRLSIRLSMHYQQRMKKSPLRVLIVGAGDTGAMITRQLRQNPLQNMEVVGLLDDDSSKHNMRIHGVPVLGNRHQILRLVPTYGVNQIVLAMPTAPGKVIREIVAMCDAVGIQTKIIPGIYELLDGKVSINQLRDVQIEDLLRREPIQTDTSAVRELIHGKRVLITGGGGSIGSELCRQVFRFHPAELIILGHGENSVFAIHNELRNWIAAGKCPALPYTSNGLLTDNSQTNTSACICRPKAVIADIRFADRIHSVFEEYRPNIVIHAAAHKHVPLMEDNLAEAITNNVLGTRNVLNAAMAVNVEHFVMISTDKAVNPTSIMGASKRVAELLVHQAAQISQKTYLAVRFGNVLGSRGNVVLTFQKQIAAGGPITVTHPEIRRFFMTIPEAVQLVLQAATLGHGGEVFTLDMGEPIKIVDLARDMIELSGLEVGQDIDIVFSGLHPGEKLYEELFIPGEQYKLTIHNKIFIACNASSFVPTHLATAISALETAAQHNDTATIVRLLSQLIPELHRPALLHQEEEGQNQVQSGQPLRMQAVGD
ncbi:MAG: polysaccharide biosynthesis protein [Chloroflexaceae bacterium]